MASFCLPVAKMVFKIIELRKIDLISSSSYVDIGKALIVVLELNIFLTHVTLFNFTAGCSNTNPQKLYHVRYNTIMINIFRIIQLKWTCSGLVRPLSIISTGEQFFTSYQHKIHGISPKLCVYYNRFHVLHQFGPIFNNVITVVPPNTAPSNTTSLPIPPPISRPK